MDNYFLHAAVERCRTLKYQFAGVWSSNNFPELKTQTFAIVNASKHNEFGTHWLLLMCTADNTILFWDSLGKDLNAYNEIYARCTKMYAIVKELLLPLQGYTSNMCGAYCIFMAHKLFSNNIDDVIASGNFTSYEVVEFINSQCGNLLQFKIN